MAIEDDVAFLGRVPLLEVLGPEALRILAIGAESRYLHGEDVLFREGEAAECAYVVQSGSVMLAGRADASRRAPMIVRQGGLIGEMALLVPGQRPVTATAREPSNLLRIPRALFRRMLEGTPDAAVRLRDYMALRSGEITGEMDQVRHRLDRIDGDSYR